MSDVIVTETADTRFARRRQNINARKVAVERAARAYATMHGWLWPELDGLAGGELARIEMRQHIRFWALAMCDEFMRSLELDTDPAADARDVAAIQDQREHDRTRRMMLKPKPSPTTHVLRSAVTR